jgi:hypothetical protein
VKTSTNKDVFMQQEQRQSFKLLSVLILIAASVVFVILYVIPFLASHGIVGDSSGYSDEQVEAYQLAQSVQDYRKKHPSPGNYAQVAIRQTYDDGSFSKWDSSGIYEGFDDVDGENSTHSEQLAHQWVIDTIIVYKNRQSWTRVTSLTIVFYSQVQVCKRCRIDMRSWPNL